VRAPEWLESKLAECEAFIRDTTSVAGLGLDYEGGRELALAKLSRRELRQARDMELAPYREEARAWRDARSRVALALRKARRLEAPALLELVRILEQVTRSQASHRRLFRDVRVRITELAAQSAAPGRTRGAAGESTGATSPRANVDEPPTDADLEAEMDRHLPAPAALEFEPDGAGLLQRLEEGRFDAPQEYRLNRQAQRMSLLSGFEVLLCPPLLTNVEHFDYQVNTARQVMRTMRGRALLCDEVGLGKTIEAGLVLKEYVIRGLARRVLVLVPPSLVSQWQDEMSDKFGLELVSFDDPEFRRHGLEAWKRCDRIVASLHTAKSPRHAERIRNVDWDLIIVDEAHHLRHRASQSWKFVNQIKSRYLLLLTATPAQNDLDELYNLITLLSPGQLRSPAEFRREFVERNDPRRPRNRTKLRELLMDVMVRNTRSRVGVRLPPREATTIAVTLTAAERELYDGITRFVREAYARLGEAPGGRTGIRTLQAEAGSSARSVRSTLSRMLQKEVPEEWRAALYALEALARRVETSGKVAALADVLHQRLAAGEKALVFTQYLETQAFLVERLTQEGIATARFNGGLSPSEKDAAIAEFAGRCRVLVSTDVGSEGRNLQFCRVIVNYDLPWNPMRIEQRVGRVHRIGQAVPVRIFNLAAPGTLEGRMLEVLDDKLNMFELVIGEIGEILGNLEDEREFEDLVLHAWAGAESDERAVERFAELGDSLASARRQHAETKAYDDAVFGQDFTAEE
jgi:superfamily II DNA or RNA helicase